MRIIRTVKDGLLASGGSDPALDMLQAEARRSHTEFYLYSAITGSIEGLKALDMGYADIAWSHLLDPASGEYNIPYLPLYLHDIEPVVINLYYRESVFLWLTIILFGSGASRI